MNDFAALLRTLSENSVEFILIGGAAATAHGASRLTNDVDIVYRRTPDNLSRLVTALAPFEPYLRGAPPGLPFRWGAETLRHGLNFTFTTTLGDIDCLGEIVGGGTFEELIPHTISITAFGTTCQVLTLETLIAVKRAAGRPKDFEAIAELEALWEESQDT